MTYHDARSRGEIADAKIRARDEDIERMKGIIERLKRERG